MRSQAMRLATFAALAAFCTYHWFALVADPPLVRLAVLVAVTSALAAGLPALGSRRGFQRAAGAVGLVLLALALALAVTGLAPRLLWPGNWSELTGNLDAGLSGVSQVELPYAGPDEWTRLGVLLATPIALVAAAVIGFWPGRGTGTRRRTAAMVVLVTLYGFSVTWEAPSAELARGALLLLLIGAYLWLPRLPPRRIAAAAAAVLVAGAAATALAARVDTHDPAVDYRDWTLFGSEREVSFDWNHSYGPFDWPQRGTVLMEIRSDRPLLWRTSVLDAFDGSRWLRGPVADVPEVPASLAGASSRMVERNRSRGWLEFPGVEVRSLRSGVVVGAGTTLEVTGLDSYDLQPDGVASVGTSSLSEGDSYSVTAYAPDPSARQLRRADGAYPRELARYTALTLPFGAEALGVAPPVAPLVPVVAPFRGSERAERSDPVGSVVAGTAYERVYELARRLTARARTSYAAVRAIERHLVSGEYRYEQDVPLRRHPLPAFLFMDREGYCQQFSGAMALMLRMTGVPARVATGFSPGYRAPEDNVYSVRDTDAHSWVEVWFRGIGWVAFDPTPGSAPAQAQSLGAFRGQGEVARFGAGRALSIEQAAEGGRAGIASPQRGGQGGPTPGGFLGLAVIVTGACAIGLFNYRRRRLERPEGAVLQLEELRRALPRLGFDAPRGVTLRQMERALAPATGAGAYVRGLAANRYAPGRPRRPGPAERRALRRALARGSRLDPIRARWRAFRSIPPGGPRRQR